MKYTEDVNSDGISDNSVLANENDVYLISETDSFLNSETDSVATTQSSNKGERPLASIWNEYNMINNRLEKLKGASCKYCSALWARGRAQEMKAHLVMKCKRKVPRKIHIKVLRDIQSADKPTPSGSSKSTTLKKRKQDYNPLSLDSYYNVIKAINKVKEARANKSLIRWIVSLGILFSAFDNLYFEDYIKILSPGYNSPNHYILASSILDAEAANIILKIEKELSKAKNLTLYVDS
ncbi:23794_t:CDS:1 [Cetraspora pellucida]|uniref:23794_t:CDS:1 n=1 Tax=Cetraspora pellucida TaxID=1433469 RepID=A0A9N9HIZ2_9GLOM|nr:23794_t:CDS:1 [Cetraspora pellucida]